MPIFWLQGEIGLPGNNGLVGGKGQKGSRGKKVILDSCLDLLPKIHCNIQCIL